jgi:hypothetical protein
MGLLVKSEKIKATPVKPSKKGVTSTRSITNQKSINTMVEPARSTDSRPISSPYYKSNPTPKPRSLSLKERIRNARKKGMRGDVYDMQHLVEEGPLSFRSFGFIGGFFMILASILDFVETDEDPYARLITFNLWLVGFISIQIEGRPFHMQIPLVYDIICLFFSFVKYVWGRGFLYFIAGCFQFFLFTKYNLISGVYFMLLGTLSIVYGYRASVRLAGLRNSISNKDEIKFMFHSFDKDRDGYLNTDEFREMLMAMDQGLDHNDFVAAMSAVDIDNNQTVSYEDLEAWWEGYNDTDLPPGVGLCGACSRGSSHNSNAHLMT